MKRMYCIALAIMMFFGICVGAGCKPENSVDSSDSGVDSGSDNGIDYSQTSGYLIKNGKTEYKIVIPSEDNDVEKFSANEMVQYIKQASGVELKVVPDEKTSGNIDDKVISIGKTKYQKSVDLSDVDYASLLTGGFITKQFHNTYILDSSSKNGLMYSAYNFLEAFFGVDYLTNDADCVPETDTVPAYYADIIEIPAIGTRD